jgi:hypothetical protein
MHGEGDLEASPEFGGPVIRDPVIDLHPGAHGAHLPQVALGFAHPWLAHSAGDLHGNRLWRDERRALVQKSLKWRDTNAKYTGHDHVIGARMLLFVSTFFCTAPSF